MYDLEASFDQRILENGRNKPTVVFAEALDPRILEAACHLTRFIRPVFLAPETQVREMAERELGHMDKNRVDFTLSQSAFLNLAERSDLLEEFARAHAEAYDISLDEARKKVAQPSFFGIWAVKFGHADTVVGGAVHPPKDFFRPMLKVLSKENFACEAGIFVLPDEHPQEVFQQNIAIFGDMGVNASMNPETLAKIAVGTCAIARDLIPESVLPVIRGAIVSYSNRGSDEGPSPDLVRQATELVPALIEERIQVGERYRSIRIQGEVRVSAAISQRSAMYYEGKDVEWAGGPNVIICPNLDMGNLLYHLYATRFPNAKKFPVLFGMRFRGVNLSMDCTPEDIRLAVKADVLRMHLYGEWQRTEFDTFFRRNRVLAINPGSTSTKISVYEGEEERFTKEIQHTAEELGPFEGLKITEQFHFRKEAVQKALEENGLSMADIDAVSGRGGLIRPIPHGTYPVNEAMVADLKEGVLGDHASNLGGLIARELVEGTGKPAFIADPVVVDEAPERTKITGIKAIRRRIISHALNQIATARRYAEENETFYDQINVIVTHMGGGISIGAHKKGHYIDVNNALDGEGPFTPERSGSLPVGQLIELCFSGKYTKAELKALNKGKGGLKDLLGTADLRALEKRYTEGDPDVVAVLDAQAYQIAKWITSMIPAFDGEKVDQILLTGGMARCKPIREQIIRLVGGTGIGVSVYPGENEMFALVKAALRVLSGKEEAREYLP